jgi:1,2-diacylglycerol 3-beta-galactosyltransferase
VIEALHIEYGERITTQMLDFIKEVLPRPLNMLPQWYPYMVRVPQAWGLGYHAINGRRRTRLINESGWPYVRRAMRRAIKRHPSDLIVSVHALATAPFLRALGRNRPPFITLVTDLVTTHAWWYHPDVDLCLVPTEEARQRALHYLMRSDQVRVVGLPVADRFCQPRGEVASLRQRLGWPTDLPVAMLVGGGEGMGPLEETAQAIARASLRLALVVICGRNQGLKERLEAQTWPIPTHIYGFVREMPDFMRAADMLVTKAGPGTLTEALNAGLPMILYSRLPGQEDGNVTYVVDQGAGVWAPSPAQITAALQRWVEDPTARLQAAQTCRRLARPQAAREIAHLLAERVGIWA